MTKQLERRREEGRHDRENYLRGEEIKREKEEKKPTTKSKKMLAGKKEEDDEEETQKCDRVI